MKASYTLAAAALLACATAAKPHHAHEAYHNQVRAPGVLEQRNVDNASCGCTTSYTTFYGEATCMDLDMGLQKCVLLTYMPSNSKYPVEHHDSAAPGDQPCSDHCPAGAGDNCYH